MRKGEKEKLTNGTVANNVIGGQQQPTRTLVRVSERKNRVSERKGRDRIHEHVMYLYSLTDSPDP